MTTKAKELKEIAETHDCQVAILRFYDRVNEKALIDAFTRCQKYNRVSKPLYLDAMNDVLKELGLMP